MYEFVNINDKGREWLDSIYKKMIVNCNVDNILYNFAMYIKSLKHNQPVFYRFIIGLMFVDDYKILSSEYRLNEYDFSRLEFYDSLNDLDDLIDIIEKNDEVLLKMVVSPILFYNYNLIDKAYMISELDTTIIENFNPFSFIEKNILFKDRSVEEINIIYNSNLDETDEEFENYDCIDKISDILHILSIGNFENFKNIILKMLKVSYKWHKSRFIENEELDFFEERLLRIVENNSIEDIIYMISNDKDIIDLLVDDYFYYFNDEEFIDKDNVETIYNNEVDEKIKIKLKEV